MLVQSGEVMGSKDPGYTLVYISFGRALVANCITLRDFLFCIRLKRLKNEF